MAAFHLRIFLLGALFFLWGQKGLDQVRSTQVFEEKIHQAKRILSKTPSGWSFAIGLDAHGTYDEPIKIHPKPPSFIQSTNGADGGGIWLNPNGRYEILINSTVSPSRMAHTLAHELQHVRDELTVDRVLAENPDLRRRISEATQLIHNQQPEKAYQSYPSETTFIMKSLFCTEYKAHTLNLTLKDEGIDDFFLKTKEGAMDHIRVGYLTRYGFRFPDEELQNLAKECAFQATPQASPLLTLMGTLFPQLNIPHTSRGINSIGLNL